MGGELGGVPLLRFWMEPGGEEFGVSIWESATGEVLRASGDTGVCFLHGDDFIFLLKRAIRSLMESERCGEEGSFGEGVPLDECPEPSNPRPPLS